MSITKREKVFMIVCVFFTLIVLVGNYVIAPMIDDYNEMKEEFEMLNFEKMDVDFSLSGEIFVHDDYNRAVKFIEENKGVFPQYMSNEDIALILSQISSQAGIEVSSLDISAPVWVNEFNGSLLTVNVNVVLQSEFNEFKDFVDLIGQSDYIRITRTNISMNSNSPFTLGLEVIMLGEGI
jgi:hypothetical protein